MLITVLIIFTPNCVALFKKFWVSKSFSIATTYLSSVLSNSFKNKYLHVLTSHAAFNFDINRCSYMSYLKTRVFIKRLKFKHTTNQADKLLINTVCIQIFEGCNFCGRWKSKIFVVLFSRICYQPFSSICIVIVLKISRI